MEKYRKFSDAATGINPFTISQNQTYLSLSIAAFLFPLRFIISLVLALLLLAADTLVYIFYALRLSFVSRHVFAHCQRLLLRCLMFTLGNILVSRKEPKGTRRADALVSVCAGDLLFANMQSLWDMCVLEVAAELPLFSVAFYIGRATDPKENANNANYKTSANSGDSAFLVFEPSPLQRWRVWRHIHRSGSLSFLCRAAGGPQTETTETTTRTTTGNITRGEGVKEGVVDISPLQQRSFRLGVPLVLFAEGSCTNGKGLLRFPPLRGPLRNSPIYLCVAAIDYDAITSLHAITPRGRALFFSAGAQRNGAAVRLAAVRGEDERNERGEREGERERERGEDMDAEEIRRALCAASRTRRPLAVGLREKCGYVREFLGTTSA